ncbi:NTP transferase domain-containing protein [Thiomicrorhabdus sp.]|uniref:NTP transferase domain-containing protein n=1 Tax=Thiomicrorhabdus sp. TaxID=2039724 RepID=UPI0029C7D267|nr:NTP transferase domain-containing protein [Thiomicrorhabdus sp.]
MEFWYWLAGKGRRVAGRDKGWILCQGRPLIAWLLASIREQLQFMPQEEYRIFISANRNMKRYAQLGEQVVADWRVGYQGPLAGIESAMGLPVAVTINRWLIIPVDAVCLPDGFVEKMLRVEQRTVCFARQGSRDHYAFLSLPGTCLSDVSAYLDQGGRSICGWLKAHSSVQPVVFDDAAVFANLNSGQDFRNGGRLQNKIYR